MSILSEDIGRIYGIIEANCIVDLGPDNKLTNYEETIFLHVVTTSKQNVTHKLLINQ